MFMIFFNKVLLDLSYVLISVICAQAKLKTFLITPYTIL